MTFQAMASGVSLTMDVDQDDPISVRLEAYGEYGDLIGWQIHLDENHAAALALALQAAVAEIQARAVGR